MSKLGTEGQPLDPGAQPPEALDRSAQALIEARLAAVEGRLHAEQVRAEGRQRDELVQAEGRLHAEQVRAEGWQRDELVQTEGRLRASVEAATRVRLTEIRNWGIAVIVIVFLFSGLTSGLTYFFGFPEVKEWVRQAVDENMSVPAINDSVDRIAESTMRPYIDEKLSSIEQRIRVADEKLAGLEAQREFLRLAMASQSRSLTLSQYQELEALSKSGGTYTDEAASAMEDVRIRLMWDAGESRWMTWVERFGRFESFGFYTNDEIAEAFLTPDRLEIAANLAREYGGKLFVPTLVHHAQTEQNVHVLNRIMTALSDLTEQQFDVFHRDKVKDWWEAHQDEYPEWPFASYVQGKRSVEAADYRAALVSFDAVLKVDPAADATRFLAVYSAAEAGDLEKAEELATGFSATAGRWARFADTNLKLARGEKQEATATLIETLKSSPASVPYVAGILRRGGWSGIDQPAVEGAIRELEEQHGGNATDHETLLLRTLVDASDAETPGQ